jgi:hypothetical protein
MKLVLALIIALTAITAEARKGGYTDFSSDVIVEVKGPNGCVPLQSGMQLGGTSPQEAATFCEKPIKVVKGYKEDILYNVPGKKAYMPVEIWEYADGRCYFAGRNKFYTVERCRSTTYAETKNWLTKP